MLPDRVSNPGPLTYEEGALPIALRGPAHFRGKKHLIAGKNTVELTVLLEETLEMQART